MSLRKDGKYYCDRCNRDVENGSIYVAAAIVTVEDGPNGFQPVALHLCRKEREGAPEGCAGLVLNAEALASYLKNKDDII
jgi:hypothetical protein